VRIVQFHPEHGPWQNRDHCPFKFYVLFHTFA
jgi:hypothetical protein